MAWFKRHTSKQAELIFHSDRASQDASKDFRDVLAEYGTTTSMSRLGNCWDNACSETCSDHSRSSACMGNAPAAGARPRTKSSDGCSSTTEPDCTRRWPTSARCGSKKLAGRSTPASQPVHETGYGIRNSGARSWLLCCSGGLHPQPGGAQLPGAQTPVWLRHRSDEPGLGTATFSGMTG